MKKFYRVNQAIKARTVRLVGPGLNEVLSLDDALRKAREQGQDLIEISSQSDPPVVRIVEFKKFLFEEKKKEKKAEKERPVLKELRFSPVIAPNDLKIRVEKAKSFLHVGHQVKLTIRFRGREITHPEVGQKKLNEIIARLNGFGKAVTTPKWFGSSLSVIFVSES